MSQQLELLQGARLEDVNAWLPTYFDRPTYLTKPLRGVGRRDRKQGFPVQLSREPEVQRHGEQEAEAGWLPYSWRVVLLGRRAVLGFLAGVSCARVLMPSYARPRSTRLESSVRPKFLSIINDTVGFLRLGTLVAAAYDL